MGDNKRKRGRKPKTPTQDTKDFPYTTAAANDVVSVTIPAAEPTTDPNDLLAPRSRRGRPRKVNKNDNPRANNIAASPERRSSRQAEQNGDLAHATSTMATATATTNSAAIVSEPVRWENVVRVVPSMDAVVKVFCVHTEPNFSLMWQRKRQYSSSSSGFAIGGRRVLTNAHSVEHHTQVKLKKRGSDTKYLATVLAIGTECDIGNGNFGCFNLVSS